MKRSKFKKLKKHGMVKSESRYGLTTYDWTAKAHTTPYESTSQLLRSSRGIVFDRWNNLVARPFDAVSQSIDLIPEEGLSVSPLLPGKALGLVYSHKGDTYAHTAGSFTNVDQDSLIQERVAPFGPDGWAPETGTTFMVQLVGPSVPSIGESEFDVDTLVCLAEVKLDGSEVPMKETDWPGNKVITSDNRTKEEVIQYLKGDVPLGVVVSWNAEGRVRRGVIRSPRQIAAEQIFRDPSVETVWGALALNGVQPEDFNHFPPLAEKVSSCLEEFHRSVLRVQEEYELHLAGLPEAVNLAPNILMSEEDFAASVEGMELAPAFLKIFRGESCHPECWEAVREAALDAS